MTDRATVTLPKPPWWGGVRAPWIAGTAYFLVLAICTLVFLGNVGEPEVSQAVLDSKHALAVDLATDLGDTLAVPQDVPTRLATQIGESPDADPQALLAALLKADPRWSGLGLLDYATGKVHATAGEAIPGDAVRAVEPDRPLTRLASGPDGPRLVTAVPVPDAYESLILSAAVRIPGAVASGTYVEIVDRDGNRVTDNGATVPTGPAATLLKRAAALAAGGGSGTQRVTTDPSAPVVAAYAPVPGGKSALGTRLAVVLQTRVAAEHESAAVVRDARTIAWWCGGVLIALTGLAALVVGRGVVRPVRRLASQLERAARGSRRVVVDGSFQQETDRIAEAVDRTRDVGAHTGEPRRGIRVSAVVLSGACAAVLLVWSAAVPLLARNATADPVPRQVLADQQVRAQMAAANIHRTITSGRWDLAAAAAAADPVGRDGQPVRPDVGRLGFLLSDEASQGRRFRSVYTVDAHGKVQDVVGASPLRKPGPVTAKGGLAQANTGGRAPIVYVATPLGADRTLVAEYDPHFLVGLVDRTGLGTLWLVDAERRITASNHGFQAFGKLPDAGLTKLAGQALDQRVSAIDGGGTSAVRTAVPLTEGQDGQDGLRWALVGERPADRFALAGTALRHHAGLVGLLGASGVALFFGWLYLVVVRPLRLIADDAERLADGDHSTVLFPQRHDEIGRIARALEVLRQGLSRRIRPSLNDDTTLIPLIPES